MPFYLLVRLILHLVASDGGSTKPRHEVCTDSLQGAVKVSGSGFDSGYAICGIFFSYSSPSWPLLSPKRGAARRPCTDSSPRAHAFRRKKSPKMPHRGPTLGRPGESMRPPLANLSCPPGSYGHRTSLASSGPAAQTSTAVLTGHRFRRRGRASARIRFDIKSPRRAGYFEENIYG